jgi:hypothetical protein
MGTPYTEPGTDANERGDRVQQPMPVPSRSDPSILDRFIALDESWVPLYAPLSRPKAKFWIKPTIGHPSYHAPSYTKESYLWQEWIFVALILGTIGGKSNNERREVQGCFG